MAFLDLKLPPPLVGAVIAGGMWSVSALGLQIHVAAAPKYAVIVFLVVTGVSFDLLGILAFRRSRTTINPLAPDRTSSMVTTGVYRVTRNPMYVGLALLLLAWAVRLSAFLPFVGPVIFVLYVTHFQIKPEERVLERIFGEAYRAYAGRVRRWL